MKVHPFVIMGILFIALGIAALVHPNLSMPSRKAIPARKIGAKTSFLPSMAGAIMRVIGVSISILVIGRSRVIS